MDCDFDNLGNDEKIKKDNEIIKKIGETIINRIHNREDSNNFEFDYNKRYKELEEQNHVFNVIY